MCAILLIFALSGCGSLEAPHWSNQLMGRLSLYEVARPPSHPRNIRDETLKLLARGADIHGGGDSRKERSIVRAPIVHLYKCEVSHSAVTPHSIVEVLLPHGERIKFSINHVNTCELLR